MGRGFPPPSLLNTESPHVSELMYPTRDIRVSYCSSVSCCGAGFTGKRGKMVGTGSYAKSCPQCQSEAFLFHEQITKRALDRYELKIKEDRKRAEALAKVVSFSEMLETLYPLSDNSDAVATFAKADESQQQIWLRNAGWQCHVHTERYKH